MPISVHARREVMLWHPVEGREREREQMETQSLFNANSTAANLTIKRINNAAHKTIPYQTQHILTVFYSPFYDCASEWALHNASDRVSLLRFVLALFKKKKKKK